MRVLVLMLGLAGWLVYFGLWLGVRMTGGLLLQFGVWGPPWVEWFELWVEPAVLLSWIMLLAWVLVRELAGPVSDNSIKAVLGPGYIEWTEDGQAPEPVCPANVRLDCGICSSSGVAVNDEGGVYEASDPDVNADKVRVCANFGCAICGDPDWKDPSCVDEYCDDICKRAREPMQVQPIDPDDTEAGKEWALARILNNPEYIESPVMSAARLDQKGPRQNAECEVVTDLHTLKVRRGNGEFNYSWSLYVKLGAELPRDMCQPVGLSGCVAAGGDASFKGCLSAAGKFGFQIMLPYA